MGERSYIVTSTDTTSLNSQALCGCTPDCFLGSTATAVNSQALCGCTPACFLGTTATATNALALCGCTPACFLGSTATAVNSQALCGCTPNCFLSAGTGLSGATNGLHTTTGVVKLGGTFTESTLLQGAYCLDIDAVRGFNVRTSGNTDMNIDAQQCGGFLIKSQCGSIDTFPDFTSAVGFLGHITEPNGFAIYDNRTGTGQTGIVYAGNYSANYGPRSLVDKQYVDTIATGLNIHTAVRLATTGSITLSGNQTIDGVLTVNGDRILVKNQSSGATNGIYIASASTWVRASDYDGTPSGEVSNGDLIPVTSGSTQNNSIWALTTLNPITVGTTPLIFSLFSTNIDIQAGQGIAISMAGGVHTVCVQLASDCGLTFCGSGLAINPWLGTTANGVGTYVNGTCICSNPNMTFNGSLLSVTGNICATSCILTPKLNLNNPTCTGRDLNVGGNGLYSNGNIQMALDKVFYIGLANDTGTRFKLFTNGCHAYFDFYDCLILRSGPVSSPDVAYLSSGGTFCACQSVKTPIVCGTSCFEGVTTKLTYSSASNDAIVINNTNTGGKCWFIGDGAGSPAGTFGFYNQTNTCVTATIGSTGIVCAGLCFAGSGAGLTGTAANLTVNNSACANGQCFCWSNQSNSPDYLWGTCANGQNWLASRAVITVGCAGTAGNALALCGCVPSCFLGATATATCATTAGNANNLGGIDCSKYIYGNTQAGSNTACPSAFCPYELPMYKSGFWEVTGAGWTPSTDWFWGLTAAHTSNSPSYNYSMQLIGKGTGVGAGTDFYIRTISGGGANTWGKILLQSTSQIDGPSLGGAGGFISSGNYGGTGTAAWFPTGIYTGGPNWIYGTTLFSGTLQDNNTSTWSICCTGNAKFGAVCATGVVIAGTVCGFGNCTYAAGINPIWRFMSAPGYGMSYCQGGVDDIRFHFGCALTPQMCINTSGVLCVTSCMVATDFKLSSDCRVKMCIEPLEVSPIDIDYKQFNLCQNPDRLRYGVIAQDLQKTNPELVNSDDKGMLTVSYIDLLIKEVAYLKCRVTELEKK